MNGLPLLKLAVLTGPSAVILAERGRSLFSALWFSLLGSGNDAACPAGLLKELNDMVSARSPACSRHSVHGSRHHCLPP